MTHVEPTSQMPQPDRVVVEPGRRPLPLSGTRTFADKLLTLHAFVFLGLAILGRGFAYTGIPEVALVLGLGCLLLVPTGVKRLFSLMPAVLLIPYIVWGAAQTVPYISEFRMYALRDAVLWGYALWAIVLGSIIASNPRRLAVMVLRYRTFVKYGICVLPVMYVAQYLLRGNMPVLNGVPLVNIQPGMTLVHIGAVGAFLIISPIPSKRLMTQLFPLAMMVLFLLANRAGQVSCFVMLLCAVMVRGVSGWVVRSVLVAAVLLALLGISGVKVQVGTREASLDAVTTAVASVIGASDESRFENTKQWRLNWWRDIYEYTVTGPFFWTGKGFGVNLANDDGYSLSARGLLRSPHNSHMTVLARMGVPGAVLWIALHASWIVSIMVAALNAHRAGRRTWNRVFLFLAIFWTGLMVNACFDVVFEGPMGGVPFWSIVGIGLGAMWVYRHAPGVLPDPEPVSRGGANS